MSTLGNLAVGVIGDSRQLNKTLDGVTGRVQKFGQDLQQMGTRLVGYGTKMTAAVTLPIIGLVTVMAKSAMDLEATEAKYNTVFEGMTDTVDQYLKDFQKLTPATTTEARGMASGIQDLLVPMGFLRDDATLLTGDFMYLIGALTNFNSATHSTEEVAMAVSSALVGQYEPLRRLGVVTNKGAIDQKVLAMGLAETAGEITEQMRAIALHEIITESSTDALAAYNEESLDTKTRLLLVKAELIDQAAAFGNLLLPMIEKAVGYLQQLNEWLATLSDEQRESILKWMGIAAAIGPVLIVVGTLMKIIGGIVAVLSAKIIIIGLVIAAIVLFGIWIYNLIKDNEELMAKLTAVWETIKETVLEVWEALRETAQVVADRIRELWEKHGERIMQFLSVIWDQISLMIETAVNIIAGIIKFVLALIRGDWEGAWEALKSVGETIWNYIKGTAENIFKGLQVALALIWDMIGERVTEAWENMKKAVVEKAQEIYTNAKQKLEDLWAWIKGIPRQAYNWGRDILLGLWNGMKDIYNNIKRWFDDKVSGLINLLNPWSKQSPSLIDNIRSGVQEIERLYASLNLPEYNIQAAAGPLAAVGSGEGLIQHIKIEANYNVTSKELAEYANNDLVKKLQGRGLGVAHR